MKPRFCCHLILFLLLLPATTAAQSSLTGWKAACLEDGRDGALLLLRDGRTLKGEIMQVTEDSVSVGVPQTPDRWNPHGLKALAVPWNNIKEITCGDPLGNGALAGFLIGTGVGITTFTDWALARDEHNEEVAMDVALGLTAGLLVVGLPSAVVGALLDAARGGRERRYVIHDRPLPGGESIGLPAPRPVDHHPLAGGGFAGIIYPGEDGHAADLPPLYGVKVLYMTRRGVFPEFSFGLAQNNAEEWTLFNAGIGLKMTENSHLNPYALVGYNRTKITYYERPGAIIDDPWEEWTQHFFWGGGVFIDLVEGRLGLRPEFKWSIGSEGFTDLTLGADAYF